MFGLRLVSLAVVALLFGNATAAPTPEYTPKYGEIVNVAPDQTTGGSVGVSLKSLPSDAYRSMLITLF